MNRYLRQVFLVYLLAVLVALVFVPWFGIPLEPWAVAPCIRYSPLWLPPRTIGYHFSFDIGRLFLEIASLSIVMASAFLCLRGREPKGTHAREEPGAAG